MTNPTTQSSAVKDALDSATELGQGIVRLGVAAVSVPLAFLPADVRSSTRGVIRAVGQFHRSILTAVVNVANDATRVLEDETAKL